MAQKSWVYPNRKHYANQRTTLNPELIRYVNVTAKNKMSTIKRFEDIEAWQLAREIYKEDMNLKKHSGYSMT